MSCFWGHKWGQWCEPEAHPYTKLVWPDGQKVHEYQAVKYLQQRICRTCGLLERKEVDEAI